MFMVMIEVNVDLKGPDLLDFSHKPIQFTQNECFVTISEPEYNQHSEKKHKKDKKKKDKKSKKRKDKKLFDGYGSEQ